jgi:hypothetical protein
LWLLIYRVAYESAQEDTALSRFQRYLEPVWN